MSNITLVLIVIAAISLFLMFQMRSAGAESAYTQAHGVYDQATVISVNNIQHQSHSQSGGTSTWYTAEVTASLNQPVGGQSQTTVRIPRAVSYTAGQTVAVLVDPQAPGYAEMPGQPNVGANDWYVALGVCAVCILLACFLGLQTLKKIRRRRNLAY